ncbi:hypothetical protein [Methylomonas sp. 11b]|uniref:hypothetical protein n=1 Tax=Methylomonas sp. 11b TaxID=1168169 RepID=UPI0012DC0FA3|nr:hypothetical protein [Methylomonas sp. 11b]
MKKPPRHSRNFSPGPSNVGLIKLRRFYISLRSAFLLLALNGCGTLFGGLTQDIKLTSDPPNAQVIDTDTGVKYNTPVIVSLEKSISHSLEFSKEGYKTEVVPLRREVRFVWWFLDAFSLGVGNLIDAASGGLFDIKPEQVHVALDPKSGS